MNKRETAIGLFNNGFNCAQSVLGAYADELGLDFSAAMRLSSSFGGGMGRMREVCGAVSGMLMVLGLKYGYSDPKAFAEKSEHYSRVQKYAGAFKEKYGSIICRELLGLDLKDGEFDAPDPEKRSRAYYQKRPCAELVGYAAELLESLEPLPEADV